MTSPSEFGKTEVQIPLRGSGMWFDPIPTLISDTKDEKWSRTRKAGPWWRRRKQTVILTVPVIVGADSVLVTREAMETLLTQAGWEKVNDEEPV